MYIVIELQTNDNGTVGNFVWAYEDRNQAEAKYHAVLSAAALSKLPIHACVLLDNSGNSYMQGVYYHDGRPRE